MARNDDKNRSQQGSTQHSQHRTSTTRDRRRDQVLNTVKERPYAAAALATVAAGAAAFFLTRSKSDKPLMNWGQDSQGDRVKGAGAYKQGSSGNDRSLETASASPSSSAGTGAGAGGTSPSAIQAATLSKTGSSTSASATGSSGSSDNLGASTSNTTGTGVSGSSNASGSGATGSTGLDKEAKTETKVGAISYGA